MEYRKFEQGKGAKLSQCLMVKEDVVNILCFILLVVTSSCLGYGQLRDENSKMISLPKGIFASAGSLDPEVVNHPLVSGNLIRVMWSSIEARPDKFDFSEIKRKISLIKGAHKKWSLSVVAGPHSPGWLYEDPFSCDPLKIRFRNQDVSVPKFWNENLQKRVEKLALALAGEFKDDDSLVLIYIPQMSANGVEGHFNGNQNADLMRQGFTEDLWVESVLRCAKTFATAFPQKPIAIELHDILNSPSAGKRIMSMIENDSSMLQQIGVALWWLSGRNNYQKDLLEAFAKFKGNLYAQLIAKSDHSNSFPSGGYEEAFKQAKELRIQYIEPWEVDIKSRKWDALLKDFNDYSEANSRLAVEKQE